MVLNLDWFFSYTGWQLQLESSVLLFNPYGGVEEMDSSLENEQRLEIMSLKVKWDYTYEETVHVIWIRPWTHIGCAHRHRRGMWDWRAEFRF